MIWGLTLEPGKQYTRIMGDEIQLSMASLETRDKFGLDPPYTQVILTTKRSEYLLCTLAHGTAFQQNLDLRLRPSETVTFSVQGQNVVYLMGYSASDSEISDSIEINFDDDREEDMISEFADSEPAPSPADVLPVPSPTLADENASSVREVAPAMTEDDEVVTEGPKDAPSPSLKREEAEPQPDEESDEFLTLESVPIKEEAADSPEMSCHGNSFDQMSQDMQEEPQRQPPVSQIEPPMTHSHTEVPQTPYMVPQRRDRPSQNIPQGCEGNIQDSTTHRYPDTAKVSITQGYHHGNTADTITQGQFEGNSDEHVTHGYQSRPGEPLRIVPVGLATTDYPDQQSEIQVVWPVGTSDHEDQRSLPHEGIATVSHETGVGNYATGMKHPPKKKPKHSRPPARAAHRPRGSIAYQCSQCERAFDCLADQLLHEERDHCGLSKNQILTCQYCGWKSQGIRKLMVHLCSHTGEKPHKCSICGKSFSQRQNRKRHERTHTGVRPYRCQICNLTFTQNHHRKKHQEIHHQIY